MNWQKAKVFFIFTVFCSVNSNAASAVQAPKTSGVLMASNKPVANAQISLISRFPEDCHTLTTTTDLKGRFSLGPLCEYRTKIPSIITDEKVTFGYQLSIAVNGNTYHWLVAEDGYSPFKQHVSINLTDKQLCIENTKRCFTLIEQHITSSTTNGRVQ